MTLRSLLLPLFGLIAGFVAIVAVLLILTAEHQNGIAKRSSEHLAQSAVLVETGKLNDSVRDYAYWNDAVENLVLTLDETWAENNVGAWANEVLDVDASFAADGRNRLYYASVDGIRQQGDVDAAFSSPQIVALIDAARASAHADDGAPAGVGGFVMLGGELAFASAAAVTWEDDRDAFDRGGAASVLVYLRRIDEELLQRFESQFLLQGLRLLPAGGEAERNGEAVMPLEAADGSLLSQLAWQPDRPGSAFLHSLALPGIAAALMLAALLWLVVYRFRKATDALQRSHLLLSEQAYDLADKAVELREARDQANAANYAKSQFLALVSHEIRTPLNAIIGFSDIIAQQAFGPQAGARYQSYAKDILASGKHLLTLINDILDLSKIEAGRFELNEEVFAVDASVERCLALFREKIDEKRLRMSYAPSGLHLYADERAFKQILINFLSNAVKFTPEGGRIWISCRADDSVFTLEVRDSGCGIDEKDLGRVLEPFGQAASALRSSEGTGLGLSISKSLAELHGGTLSIGPAEVKGTRVLLKLAASRLRRPRPQIAAGA